MVSAYFDQFNVIKLIDCGDWGVFTNSSMMLVLAIVGVGWLLLGSRLVPRR